MSAHRVVATLLLALIAGACDSVTRTDSRFATPEHTVETLFSAYGIEDVSQAEVRERIARGESFELRDRETYARCFTDLDAPGGEGMAGYVLGMLAAAKDELRYETIEDRGYAIPRRDVRVVMRRGEDGAYRIVLRESVPEQVRRDLLRVEENASRRVPR